MIEAKEFQLGGVFTDSFGDQAVLDEDSLETLLSVRNYNDWKPVPLTKEILKQNLGFEVHDLGEHWQAEHGDFVIIQPKFQMVEGVEMPWVMGYKTTISRTYSFTSVHQLQNVYYIMEKRELPWKQTK